MGRYSPFNIRNIRKKAKDRKFKEKYGRAPVKPRSVPLTGMSNINQSKEWASAQNHKIKAEAKSAKQHTAQWSRPAATFEIKATFFGSNDSSMGSLYKAPSMFSHVSVWEAKDDVSFMACSAVTVILATSPRALLMYLEQYKYGLGICASVENDKPISVPIRVRGGTFRPSSDHMKCGTYVSWVADAAKALASNSMALGAPTSILQDVTAIVRTAIPLGMEANDRSSQQKKISEKAKNEQLLQQLRDTQPEKHALGGCPILMGIAFSHFDGELVGGDRYYTFDDLQHNNAVIDAIYAAHSQLKGEQSKL